METDRRDPRLIEQLARIRKSFPWLTLNDYATGRTLPALPAQTLPGRGFCPLLWRQFDVGQDGRAHPCCRSYTTDLGSPAEAWLGEPLRELRRQILRGHVDAERFAACAACPNLGFGKPVGWNSENDSSASSQIAAPVCGVGRRVAGVSTGALSNLFRCFALAVR
jgi:hypothetical protein